MIVFLMLMDAVLPSDSFWFGQSFNLRSVRCQCADSSQKNQFIIPSHS